MTDNCSTCVFYRQQTIATADGKLSSLWGCHYDAPSLDQNGRAIWRFCDPADWCGDGISTADGHFFSTKLNQGPQGTQGLQGIQGTQGATGIGFDAGRAFFRDTATTTDATPKIIRSIPIALNASVYVEVNAKAIDSTHLLVAGINTQNWFGRGASGVFAAGTDNILETDNFPGVISTTLAANVGANTIDISIVGKLATTFTWSVSTVVDNG